MTTEIQKYESGLDNEAHNKLANTFNPFMESVGGLIEKAKTIEVKDESDTQAMKVARTTRLSLRTVRCSVETTRKKLKENCLLEGKAIDGMANIIKYLIVPVEKELQEKEDVIKLAEERRKKLLSEDRTKQLEVFDVDCTYYQLEEMKEEAFEDLLLASKLAYQNKIDAEKAEQKRIEDERKAAEKVEADRVAKEKADREKREEEQRIAREKAEKVAEEAQAKADLEAQARKKAEDKEKAAQKKIDDMKKAEEVRVKKEAEAKAAKEKAEKDAELERVQAEQEAEQKAKAAPDKEKLTKLVDAICVLDMPTVSSDIALDVIANVKGSLNGVVKKLRNCIAELEK